MWAKASRRRPHGLVRGHNARITATTARVAQAHGADRLAIVGDKGEVSARTGDAALGGDGSEGSSPRGRVRVAEW